MGTLSYLCNNSLSLKQSLFKKHKIVAILLTDIVVNLIVFFFFEIGCCKGMFFVISVLCYLMKWLFQKCAQIHLNHFKPYYVILIYFLLHSLTHFWVVYLKDQTEFSGLKSYISRKCICRYQLKYCKLEMLPAMCQWDNGTCPIFCWVTAITASGRLVPFNASDNQNKSCGFWAHKATQYTCRTILIDDKS